MFYYLSAFSQSAILPLGVDFQQSLTTFAIPTDEDALTSGDIVLVEQIGHVEINAPVVLFIAEFQIGEGYGWDLKRVFLISIR
ncbi:hypothetical protein D3C80_210460 [compost metagenome]